MRLALRLAVVKHVGGWSGHYGGLSRAQYYGDTPGNLSQCYVVF